MGQGAAATHVKAAAGFPDRLAYTAVCAPNRAAAEHLAGQLDGAEVFSGLEGLLAHAEVDAVDICTPYHLHVEQAVLAAWAGKHVLVEKPVACTMQECHTMVRATDDAGVTLMVAQYQRYDPNYVGVKHLIDTGALGTIRAVRIGAMQNLPSYLPESSGIFSSGARMTQCGLRERAGVPSGQAPSTALL